MMMNWYLAEEDIRKAERLLAEERVYPSKTKRVP
jgi:hypothetical protein